MILPSFRSRIWATVFFVFAVAGVGSYLFRQQHGIALVEEWSQEITIASQEASLPNPFLLAGLVFAESRGKANAISKVGALDYASLCPPLPRSWPTAMTFQARLTSPWIICEWVLTI